MKPEAIPCGAAAAAAAAASSRYTMRPVSFILAWLWCATLFHGAASTDDNLHIFQPDNQEPFPSEACPKVCSDIFSKLEDGPLGSARRTQMILVQERGEPKSGTGFMFEWATTALASSCMYLQNAYGEGSCWIEWTQYNRTMTFNPSMSAASPSPCTCHDVDKVVISISNFDKHTLPVEDSCSFSHNSGISSVHAQVCIPPGGSIRVPENHAELFECARQSACQVVDDRLQMSVMRDPRPIAVSAFFHMLRVHPASLRTASVDEYALTLLPVACKWVSIRYLLFTEILGHKSSLFWYDDAQANPSEWHDDFYELIGLRMPMSVVNKSVAIATGQVLDSRLAVFPVKGVDVHSGWSEKQKAGKRTFRDEISAATLSKMDEMLRVWLPPVLLDKFEII